LPIKQSLDMKLIFIQLILTVFFLLSCKKSEIQDRCEKCFTSNATCEKAGGVIEWTINSENKVITDGFFEANINAGDGEVQHYFKFLGEFKSCILEDIGGSTTSKKEKFGVGEYTFFLVTVSFKDFCGKDSGFGGGGSGGLVFSGVLKVSAYNGKNAEGSFKITNQTGGATQCMPDKWVVEGSFKDVPVY
jgi:hypothetical protein